MKYYCNPINIDYRYQFNQDQNNQRMAIAREAADPSMILFQGKYYIFASMNLSVWVSEDLVNWKSHRLPENLPLYDYAPDVRVIGDYVYYSASKHGEVCDYYRTKDIINGPYEVIKGSFDFFDPNLFQDTDGRIYFYWGCSNTLPIWGVEVEANTMLPIGEKTELIEGLPEEIGYERFGEDHSRSPKTTEEIEIAFENFVKKQGQDVETIPQEYIPIIKGMVGDRPFIEGAWMDKIGDKYYLQYACPGTQFNTYADGVYIGDSPLGPFRLADNNPYSYKPGGFLTGAGHGSTMWDKTGNVWHASTMRISMNHNFERRVGIWPAGVDSDGDLYCNQRFGDWPRMVQSENVNPWENPQWYLLSYNKPVTASSYQENKSPRFVTDENVRTWWQASTNEAGEWIQVDLGKTMNVNAIQINFADDELDLESPGEIRGTMQGRYIDENTYYTRWKLEGSLDGKEYFIIQDKTEALSDLPHDLVVVESGVVARFLKLTVVEVPYGQNPCVSGLRVFGYGDGPLPSIPNYSVERTNELDMIVNISSDEKVGYNILWGSSPEKLYHCYQTYKSEQNIGALVKDRNYYIRVDAFNENGITEGVTCLVK